MKLRSRISISILSVVVILFAVVITYVSWASSRKSRVDAEALALETVGKLSKEIQVMMERELSVIESIATIVEQMDRARPGARETLVGIVSAGTIHSARTSNMWIAFEPNAFDDMDAAYADTKEYGKSGQMIVSVNDNKDGTVTRTNDITPEVLYDPKEAEWYQTPLRTGEVTITEPREYAYPDGRRQFVSSLCAPIRLGGRVAGVVGADLDYTEIRQIVTSTHVISSRTSLLLIGNEGTVISALRPEDIGKAVTEFLKGQDDANVVLRAIRNGEPYTAYHRSVLSGLMSMKSYIPVKVGDAKQFLSLNVNVPLVDMLREARAMTRNTIIAAFIGIVVLAGVVVWIAGQVVKPIQAVSDLLHRAGELNFQTDTTKIWLLKYKDEIGAMARAYLSFQTSLTNVLHSLRGESEHFSSTAQNLAAISQESVASMQEVKASVDEVVRLSQSNATALEEANVSMDEISQAAAATATSAESGAAAAANTASLTQEAAGEVNAVVDRIRQAGTYSKESEASIRKVSDSVGSITGFVATITGIADQTNLLALNAAIEAARAGAAGRGFAVVAEEVRKLAEESARSAEEVQKRISVLKNDTERASSVTRDMENILNETVAQASQAKERLSRSMAEVDTLSNGVQGIAAAAQEQAASCGEMAGTVTQVSEATSEAVQNLGNIQSATEDTAAASENVAREAQGLSEGVEKLREIVAMFRHDDVTENGKELMRLEGKAR